MTPIATGTAYIVLNNRSEMLFKEAILISTFYMNVVSVQKFSKRGYQWNNLIGALTSPLRATYFIMYDLYN